MSQEGTSEEVHQQYVDTMGKELGDLYFRLWNECVLLHWKWEEFVTLFGTSPERLALLNKAAGAFFRVVQDTLWEDVLLHISRLTDPPRSAGKDTLSLQRLPVLVDDTIKPEVEKQLEACLTACEFARDWRNRRLAHRDLRLALDDPTSVPLAPASRKAVKDALAAIAALLNSVELRYTGLTVMYDLHPLGNAECLLCVLQDGLQAEADRCERIKSGKFTREDLRRPPEL
ncbi:MAG: hypothetical protein L0387_23045 [Acidobacteria bacterium]|nr:hypothetical protein [Acidobacteriota bacterium]